MTTQKSTDSGSSRCSIARQLRDGAIDHRSEEIRSHVGICEECAALVAAEGLLAFGFAALKEEKFQPTPFAIVRMKAMATSVNNLASERRASIMSRVFNQLKIHPKLTLSAGAVMVALAVVTLIPFTYDKTVGYQVAVGAVDKSIALDSERIQQLLEELGITNACVQVGDCDQTCNLTISDLKSPQDAKLVLAAFKEFDKIEVLQDVTAMTVDESGNLVERAHEMFFINMTDSSVSEEGLHEMLLERLGSDFADKANIWVSREGEGVQTLMICDSSNTTFCADSTAGGIQKVIRMSGAGNGTMSFTSDSGGTVLMKRISMDCLGGVNIAGLAGAPIDAKLFKGGAIDQKALADLRAQGFNVTVAEPGGVVRIPKGSLTDKMKANLEKQGVTVVETAEVAENGKCIVIVSGSSVGTVSASSSPEQLEKEANGALPDGFALEQNYPNPFNPTTKIAFTLPTAEQATLEVYNLMGQRVKTLVDGRLSAGRHEFEWDATDASGHKVASGMYFYRFAAGSVFQTKKMSLLK